MIFQDPYESLDARFTVGEIVAEPLRIHGVYRSAGVARVRELLASVGLDGVDLDSYPGEYSGGQRQRIGIARALALDPELVICDEPTSALDVSVQAQILNVLLDLQETRGISLLMISHDLQVVRRMSDDVVVMYAGAVMERGPAERRDGGAAASRTRGRCSTRFPGTAPAERRLATRLRSAEGIASAATVGCPFATRCPKVQEICRAERPLLTESAHAAACHFPERTPERDGDT